MKNVTLTFLFLAAIVLAACSKSVPGAAVAVIRVTVGNQPGTNADDLVTTAFTSFSFAQHADEALGLAKQWGLPAKEANEKIRAAISVRKGGKPELFVVEAAGLDHDAAVKIVNELCNYYGSTHPSISLNGGPAAAVHVSLVQAAK
ncbi:MAG: hypothetical protein ABSH48_17120 [Verrucomicrobiota bacterium]|jgi:hypothetical protein